MTHPEPEKVGKDIAATPVSDRAPRTDRTNELPMRDRERDGEKEREGECRSHSLEILSYREMLALQLD